MNLGDKLRELRLGKKLSQNDLADKSGVPQHNINAIEGSRSKNPSADTLLKLSEALEIDVNELYEAAGYNHIVPTPKNILVHRLEEWERKHELEMNELHEILRELRRLQ